MYNWLKMKGFFVFVYIYNCIYLECEVHIFKRQQTCFWIRPEFAGERLNGEKGLWSVKSRKIFILIYHVYFKQMTQTLIYL